MVYADTDFFLALLKNKDWLKEKALAVLREYKDNITTSLTTYLELMLLSRKFGLDPVMITASVMEITRSFDERILRASILISQGMEVFDAFHTAFSETEIVSFDHVYEEFGYRRIKLEDLWRSIFIEIS
ncbi:pilus assembly protein [Sulfurisphaera ohwakuensis]|uniref:Pilus assembly protein n=1 Tax=Sulfurisphaera ohwakuensis TaxID=69656 RepID=A0A650CGY3_SULOH|nr:pilus assembly protein [Sulfurisphaera ohwakuensis]MBB5254196.1 putative nucleic acid-binding protein [Sulfurisphaera ohwakuensis]QGR16797.1 pilus assembly protein [Sulfurisphaera ohwakuensis]